jgi:DNA-binding beta-propeller fold protein YncE
MSTLVADSTNHLIRHIVISTATVTTLAGVAGPAGSTNGVGTIARPVGVSISPDGVYALVADYDNDLIRHIIISTATVTTLAGVAGSPGSTNGVGTIARFNGPYGVNISPDGVYALVADYSNHLIRHIVISTATVTTLAGVAGPAGSTNGVGTIARPVGVSISPDGVYALVADYDNDLIRHIIISTASVTTLAGVAGSGGSTNGVGTIARFYNPAGVSISPDGVNALVSDHGNHLIRQIVISTATRSALPSPAPTSLPTDNPQVNQQHNPLVNQQHNPPVNQQDNPQVNQQHNPLVNQQHNPQVNQQDNPQVNQQHNPLVNQQHNPQVNQQHNPLVNQQHNPLVNQQHNPQVNQQHNPLVNQQHNPPVNQQDNLLVNKQDNPPVNQQDNPLVNQQDNPLVNQQDNPLVNQQDNPQVNQQDNPLVNQQHNPQVNQQDNPLVNQQDNPLVNQQHNPLVNQQHNPLVNQ